MYEGKVLLIRRGKEPLKGRWVVPGGTVELGEGLEAALVREMEEETGLIVRPLELLTVFDRIERGDDGHVAWHFVIADYLCERITGVPRAGSDAEEVALVAPEDLAAFDLPAKALEVVRHGLDRVAARGLVAATGSE